MPYNESWNAGDPGFVEWMRGMSYDMNRLKEGMPWRNIISLVPSSSPVTLTKLHIARIGFMVFLLLRGVNGGGGAAQNFVPGNILPAGLRPVADMYLRPLGTTSEQFMIGATGSIGCSGAAVTSTSSDVLIMWPTFNAFPAPNTYPGVAA